MSFHSKYATLIWDGLYSVEIPDHLTINPDYLKKFGTYSTGDRKYDEMLSNTFVTVMLPIIQLINYYQAGVEVRIPTRESLVKMHKDMELYLGEWKNHVQTSIHGKMDYEQHKEMITSIENFSKHIYGRLNPSELVNQLFSKRAMKKRIGLINPLEDKREEVEQQLDKRDYEGIRKLIQSSRNKNGGGRYG